MKTRDMFGEVETVKGSIPQGIVLRETKYGVMLEKHMDETSTMVDVLHFFDGYILRDQDDFEDCLEDAREYEPNKNIPIYIKYLHEERPDYENLSEEEKKAELLKVIEQRMKAPWKF